MCKNIKLAFILTILFLSNGINAISVVYGDSRSQPEMHQKIVAQLVKFHPKAVFHTGDMNSYGMRQSEYDQFMSIIKPITDDSRFYPVKVNHEQNSELYLENFPQLNGHTYYSVYDDSLVWIILDTTMKIAKGSAQYKWLVTTLEINKDKPMIMLMHHPIYSSGHHGDELGLSLFLPELIANYPVLATFCAHDHMYERSERNGQYFIVSGGAGAPLYKVESHNPYSKKIFLGHNFCVLDYKNGVLNVSAYDIQGNLIDEFKSELKKRGINK